MATTSTRAVYYALNEQPSCLYQLERSLSSLRQHNNKIKVYIVYFGPHSEEISVVSHRHGAELIRRQTNLTGSYVLFVKWLALQQEFPEDDLVFLDVDTFISDDVDKLFEIGPEEFLARPEIDCSPDLEGYPCKIGYEMCHESQVDHSSFRRVCRLLGSLELPIFNTGVLIFQHGFHRKVADQVPWLMQIRQHFARGRLVYPCSNSQLLDEIIASLALGQIPDLSWRFIDPETCPFYMEYAVRDVDGPGVVMHIFNWYYRAFLLDFAGRSEELEYHERFKPRGSSVFDQFCVRFSGRRYLPEGLRELWFRWSEWRLRRILRSS